MRRSFLRSTATEALPTGTARSDLRTRWLVARLARSHDPARTAEQRWLEQARERLHRPARRTRPEKPEPEETDR
jgi:hypothetical protein